MPFALYDLEWSSEKDADVMQKFLTMWRHLRHVVLHFVRGHRGAYETAHTWAAMKAAWEYGACVEQVRACDKRIPYMDLPRGDSYHEYHPNDTDLDTGTIKQQQILHYSRAPAH